MLCAKIYLVICNVIFYIDNFLLYTTKHKLKKDSGVLLLIFIFVIVSTRGSVTVARGAHNPKVGGSIPPPATDTNEKELPIGGSFSFAIGL